MFLSFIALTPHHSKGVLEVRNSICFNSSFLVKRFAPQLLPRAAQIKHCLQQNSAFLLLSGCAQPTKVTRWRRPQAGSRRQFPMVRAGCRTNISLCWHCSAEVKEKPSWADNLKDAQHRLPLLAVVRVIKNPLGTVQP